MRRTSVLAVLSLLFLALTGTAAQASNPHLVTGFAAPECSVTGTTVTCTGTEIAGVGNNNAVATLDVTATGVVECNNPGENRNNPIEVHETTFGFSSTSGVLEPKNGRLAVPELSATAPTALTPEQESAFCPNPNWEADLLAETVTITGFSYSIDFLTRDGAENFLTITGP